MAEELSRTYKDGSPAAKWDLVKGYSVDLGHEIIGLVTNFHRDVTDRTHAPNHIATNMKVACVTIPNFVYRGFWITEDGTETQASDSYDIRTTTIMCNSNLFEKVIKQWIPYDERSVCSNSSLE